MLPSEFGLRFVQCNKVSNLKMRASKDAYSETGHSQTSLLFYSWHVESVPHNVQCLYIQDIPQGPDFG